MLIKTVASYCENSCYSYFLKEKKNLKENAHSCVQHFCVCVFTVWKIFINLISIWYECGLCTVEYCTIRYTVHVRACSRKLIALGNFCLVLFLYGHHCLAMRTKFSGTKFNTQRKPNVRYTLVVFTIIIIFYQQIMLSKQERFCFEGNKIRNFRASMYVCLYDSFL